MKKRSAISTLACGSLLFLGTLGALSSCATPGKDTGIGAGVGAAGGAAIGALAGGGKGALIGAGVGALVGGSVGNYLDKQANELKQVADAHRTADGIMVSLKNDLLFDTDSSVVKPKADLQLERLGTIIAKYPKDKITIKGFTDNTGDRRHNQTLSQERAGSVAARLRERGVMPTQIRALGEGQGNPVASNATRAGRAKNRRVELIIRMPTDERASG